MELNEYFDSREIDRLGACVADLRRQLAEAQRQLADPPPISVSKQPAAPSEVERLAGELCEWILKDGGYGKSDADKLARDLQAALRKGGGDGKA